MGWVKMQSQTEFIKSKMTMDVVGEKFGRQKLNDFYIENGGD